MKLWRELRGWLKGRKPAYGDDVASDPVRPHGERITAMNGVTIPPGGSASFELNLADFIEDPEVLAAIGRGEHKLSVAHGPEIRTGNQCESSFELLVDGERIAAGRICYTIPDEEML